MISQVSLNEWYPVALAAEKFALPSQQVMVLGMPFTLKYDDTSGWRVRDAEGQARDCITAYGHVWLCPGTPDHPIFDLPEAAQAGRRLVDCGAVRVKCSPLRAIENFLDIAHFPFVHTDILGAEPNTAVERYKVDITEDKDEIWATKVKFFQPQAAKSASGGILTEYMYRVPAPMVAVLYKSCPPRPEEWDVITIFVQPLSEELCDVWPYMALFDDDSSMEEMIQFQQTIFLQDRSILENQIPRKLPLDPRMEVPTRADMTSIAYRRWLKKRGALYGAALEVA